VGEATFGAKSPAETELVGGRDDTDGRSRDHGQVRDVGKRRSQRDDLVDVFGAALREDFGQQSASAVPDEGHRRRVFFMDIANAVAEPGQHAL